MTHYSDWCLFITQLRRGIKRDRLMKEFMNALNRFQKLQREIAHREKEELASAKRAHKNISHVR